MLRSVALSTLDYVGLNSPKLSATKVVRECDTKMGSTSIEKYLLDGMDIQA